MSQGTRITLTKIESESRAGGALIDKILTICHDGMIATHEIEDLHQFLEQTESDINAFGYLRALTREMLSDGIINDTEAYHLKRAFERVVPKSVRGIVSTHLTEVGLPTTTTSNESSDWRDEAATDKQLRFISDLGGISNPEMTKGEASELIESLLDRRPPSPRQQMIIRFFDRIDLLEATKDDVSQWIDAIYTTDPGLQRAWEQFKCDTNHDYSSHDPTIVPIGAYRYYMQEHRGAKSWFRRFGYLFLIGLIAILVIAFAAFADATL